MSFNAYLVIPIIGLNIRVWEKKYHREGWIETSCKDTAVYWNREMAGGKPSFCLSLNILLE